MSVAWAVVPAGLLYLSILFAIAHWGDRNARPLLRGAGRSAVYALSLGVFCTAWTFFGSVGLASRSGLDFLAIYIGPILVIGLGHTVVARVLRIAKAQNITSVADFVAARYGKSEGVAALVACVAVVAAVPYIALQLKAVSAALGLFLSPDAAPMSRNLPVLGDVALVVALGLAGFAVAFGTRHADATEHQDGLTIAIALESMVKLLAFLCVGVYVVFWMFGGPGGIETEITLKGLSSDLLANTSGLGSFLTLTLLAACAALLMPRQFHMGVVENRAVEDV
jgi:Na+/proline symporter